MGEVTTLVSRAAVLSLVLCLSFLMVATSGRTEMVSIYDDDTLNCRKTCTRAFTNDLTRPTDKGVDVTFTVRVRAFGSDAELREAWQRDWARHYPQWNPMGHEAFYIHASSRAPEVWVRVREGRSGKLVLPLWVVGHEIAHAIQRLHPGVEDPDNYARPISVRFAGSWDSGREPAAAPALVPLRELPPE